MEGNKKMIKKLSYLIMSIFSWGLGVLFLKKVIFDHLLLGDKGIISLLFGWSLVWLVSIIYCMNYNNEK
jgi:hypothetical protein